MNTEVNIVTTNSKRTRASNKPDPWCFFTRSVTAVLLSLIPAVVSAQISDNSYTCVLGEQSRQITLVYLGTPGDVPCEIQELKNNGNTKALWRAENDATFCRRQFDSYRNMLENNGWPCESGSTRQTPQISSPAVSITFENSVATDTNPIAAITTVQTPETQVELHENKSATSVQHPSPTPPRAKHGNLTADDIREMDDWLIYLSAQTMSSINTLVPDPSTFEDYQQRELINSNNIYERLQSRIEFLNKLLSGQTAVQPELSATDF